jgi:hypothetical protein
VRRLAVLSIEQLAIAVALIFGGGILMLLLGTQILEWYWLVLLAAIGLGIGAWRVRSRVFGRYRVAQLLDRTLGLHDSLSSAWFLRSQPDAEVAAAASFQLEYAERLAATVYPANALPLTRGRVWVLAGGLAAVAFGLFAVRYLVTNSLSLERALVPLYHGDVFARREPAPPLKNRSLDDPSGSDRSKKEAWPAGNAPKSERQDESGSSEVKTGSAASEQASPQSQPKVNNGLETGAGDKPATQSQSREQASEQSQQQGTPQRSAAKDQEASDQQSASGLMDKMKDALSSLMAKMRPNSSAQKSQQESQRSTDGQQASEKASAKNDPNGDSQKNAGNQQASEDQSAEGQPQGQTTEKTQSSQGRNSNQPTDKEGTDSQSGVGRQDGDKEARESEQLKAMGKLAEIIGKRSASVTGDMVVENPPGKQGLKTDYSRRLGQHADLGGEINRDEIPLMYQQYVREYMQQIHNQPKRQ